MTTSSGSLKQIGSAFGALSAVALLLPASVAAQSSGNWQAQAPPPRAPVATASPVPRNQNEGLRDTGKTADTGSGQVGRRQSARETARFAAPLSRYSNRIQNRVQTRIANRIDRDYDPTAGTQAPFETAEGRAKAATRRAPR